MKLEKKIVVDRNEFTGFINTCIITAKRLEARGNLESAVDWRENAASTYNRVGDTQKRDEQHLLAAVICEKIAATNEKDGYIGHAAYYMERAEKLYNHLSDRDKAEECYSKAIALSERYIKESELRDPKYISTEERDKITGLMRTLESVTTRLARIVEIANKT